ncbi:MAG: DUF6427 family protein [Flavobacteriales bacterium]|nr:DUF6427 family protein [Flavobacteriales bacterium]
MSLPLLIGILASSIFFTEPQSRDAFYQWQTDLLNTVYANDLIHFGLVVFLVSLTSHQLNNLVNRHDFYNKATFLPGLIYSLTLVSFGQLQLSSDLLSHLFIVLSLMQIFKIRRQEEAKAIVFNSSFLLGVSVMISPLLFIVCLIPWIALIIFRPFVWREWVMGIIGFTIPVIYQFSIAYLFTGNFTLPLTSNDIQLEEIQMSGFDLTIYEISCQTYFLLFALYSFWRLLVINTTEVVRFKKQSQMLIHLCWTLGLGFILEWLLFNQYLLALAIPLSIIISISLLHSKNSTVVNSIVIIWFIISQAILFV